MPAAVLVRPEVIARIDRYAGIIDPAAKAQGLSPAWVKAFIAAETGGKADSVSSSGYRGLMQSSRDAEDDDPKVSVKKGTAKLKTFEGSLQRLLSPLGLDYRAQDERTRLAWLARAYNAGPGTVQQAVKYGGAAWQDAEPYQRALLQTGAYATGPAAGDKKAEAEKWRKQLAGKGLTLQQARAQGMPAFVEAAIVAKWKATAGYVAKILAYAQHYGAAR